MSKNVRKNLESLIASLKNYVKSNEVTIKRVLKELDDFGSVMKEDEQVKRYSEDIFFWENVKKASQQVVHIPLNVSEDILEYLCQETLDTAELERRIGKLDALELIMKLDEPEQEDYIFRKYLLDIMMAYKADPNSYRLYIPALFSVIEGTLGGIFHITKEGTAGEIKRKMYVMEDLFHYIYSNQLIGTSGTFWMNLFLTNFKEIFVTITSRSSEEEVHLNRNRVLHGKSNPDKWKVEDFEKLVNLVHTILFARKTIDSFPELFVFLQEDKQYEFKELVFKNYEEYIRKLYPNPPKENEKKRNLRKEIKKNMKSDLKDLLGSDPIVTNEILDNSSFYTITEIIFK